MASAVAGGLVVSVVLLSAVAEGLVLAGGLSFGGGEATSRTKVFLGCFDFCLLVADFFLGMAGFFFLGGGEGGSEAAPLAARFLDFVFTVFIEFSSLSPCFLSSTLIAFSSPIARTVALYVLLSDHLTVHVAETWSVDTAGEVTLLIEMMLKLEASVAAPFFTCLLQSPFFCTCKSTHRGSSLK